MSRIGKIARLPKAVREELNRRLEDGEQQNRLVEWLNGREDVQALLRAHYDGRAGSTGSPQAINEPNLTAWVQGGYEDWRRQEESQAAAERLTEESAALGVITGDRGLGDRVAMMAALAIGEQLMAVRRMEDGDEKRRAVLKLVRGLVRLRKADRECERAQRDAAQAERAKEMHEAWAERAGRRTENARGQGTIPQVGAQPANTGQPVAALGTTGLRANATFGADGDVRARMAEVIAGMSDEQIAESLRRSGHIRERMTEDRGRSAEGGTEGEPAPVRQSVQDMISPRCGGAANTSQSVASLGTGQTQRLEQIWWTEEDEALKGDDDEGEEEAAAGGKAVATRSTPVRQGSGQTQRLEPAPVRQGVQDTISPRCGGAANTSQRVASLGTGQTQRLGAEGHSIVPPEGGTTNTSFGADLSGHKAPPTVQTEPAGGGLTQA